MNRSASSLFRHGGAAFTLLELLVVIVVIAILAGLMLPVMSTIRARGDSIQCISNLRQIGVAIAGYVGDNDGVLPGPVIAGQMPTYKSTDATSLALILAKYLNLPTTPTGTQKAPVFLCPSYVKANPALDQPVYFAADINNVGPSSSTLSPFGVTSGQPLRLSAINGLNNNQGNPISLGSTIALRDYVAASATLVTTTVTYTSPKPVHGDHCNTPFYDWHVGAVDPNTLQPK